MSRVRFENGVVVFRCPGCKLSHALPVHAAAADVVNWQFNGNADLPTLSPSILARGGCCYDRLWHQQAKRLDEPCDKDAPGEDGISMCHVCHSFVIDGRIQFLPDCTHGLAGQTVDLPELAE